MIEYDDGQLDYGQSKPETQPEPEPPSVEQLDCYISVRLPPKMMAVIEQLIGIGLFGTTPEEVVERMAAEEMRRWLPR